MKKRPHIPIRWVRKMLKQQGAWCAVPGCHQALEIYQGRRNFIVEHRVPRALLPARKADRLSNLELRCIQHANEKTNRPKSGGIGGDLFEIAKTKRLKRKRAKPRTKKYPWVSRKMQSRGFAKVHRPMRARPIP